MGLTGDGHISSRSVSEKMLAVWNERVPNMARTPLVPTEAAAFAQEEGSGGEGLGSPLSFQRFQAGT